MNEDIFDRLERLCEGQIDLHEAIRYCADWEGHVKLETLVDFIVRRKEALRVQNLN